MSDILTEAREVLSYAWNIGYIAGDSGALEHASGVWHAMARDLRHLQETLDHAVSSQLTSGRGGNWNDPAGDAFQTFWKNTSKDIGDLASKYDQMGKALHDISGEVENFNSATRSVVLELSIWVAVTVGMAWIPGVDLVEEAAAAARGSWLVYRFWQLIRLIVLFLNGVRAAFAINLTIFYVSRLVERGILNPVHDPTKGWSKYDGQQMLWGSLIASGFSSLIGLPRAIGTVKALGTLGTGLSDGSLSAGASVTDDALANTIKQAGFKGLSSVPTAAQVSARLDGLWVKMPGMLRGITDINPPGLLAGKIWYSRLPLISALPLTARGATVFDMTVERLLVSLGTANAANLFNRGVIQGFGPDYGTVVRTGTLSSAGPAGLIALGNAISFLVGGRALPLALTLPTVITLNSTLEIFFPAVRDARGLHFGSLILEMPKAQAFQLGPTGHMVVGAPPTYVVKAGDTLWKIAMGEYGDPTAFPAIWRRNHIANPNLIYPGEVLVLPPILAPA